MRLSPASLLLLVLALATTAGCCCCCFCCFISCSCCCDGSSCCDCWPCSVFFTIVSAFRRFLNRASLFACTAAWASYVISAFVRAPAWKRGATYVSLRKYPSTSNGLWRWAGWEGKKACWCSAMRLEKDDDDDDVFKEDADAPMLLLLLSALSLPCCSCCCSC